MMSVLTKDLRIEMPSTTGEYIRWQALIVNLNQQTKRNRQ
jgi:hypothetical protein